MWVIVSVSWGCEGLAACAGCGQYELGLLQSLCNHMISICGSILSASPSRHRHCLFSCLSQDAPTWAVLTVLASSFSQRRRDLLSPFKPVVFPQQLLRSFSQTLFPQRDFFLFCSIFSSSTVTLGFLVDNFVNTVINYTWYVFWLAVHL